MSDQPSRDVHITPIHHPIEATVRVPGSKSLTNRALILAALHSRNSACRLTGALRSEDTELMVDALNTLGIQTEPRWSEHTITVQQNTTGRLIPVPEARLFLGNSGTSLRFLMAFCSLSEGTFHFDGISRMRERPLAELMRVLEQLGAKPHYEQQADCLPLSLECCGWATSTTQPIPVGAKKSSQFLSAMLMAASAANAAYRFRIAGERVSEPYISMTVELLRQWGCTIDTTAAGTEFHIDPQRPHHAPPTGFAIEPDASSASYFFAAAAITAGQVIVHGTRSDMLQGDIHFLNCLEQMGCRVDATPAGLCLLGTENLCGITVDMNAISDTVMTLATVACFANGPTTITNVEHIRFKETDRIAATATELRRAGVSVEEHQDGLTIHPRAMHGAAFHTYNDHRMAMSLALLGLRVPDVIITNADCVRKTYPDFWGDFQRLGSKPQ